MPDVEETRYRPSNGTEGCFFWERFCFRCKRDDDVENDPCEINNRAMLFNIADDEYPTEWTYDADGNPTCTAFEPIVPGRCGSTTDLFGGE